MSNYDDYEFFGGIHHCFHDTQSSCYTSASASIYVPWSTMNAVEIMSLINELSEYFAIYPLFGRNMKHNILLDVTIKASELHEQHSFELPSPQKLKDIQNKVSHYDSFNVLLKLLTCFRCLIQNMVWIIPIMCA